MLNKIEFDLWADGYDKTVGISAEHKESTDQISPTDANKLLFY